MAREKRVLTMEQFKEKHKRLIELGVITFAEESPTVINVVNKLIDEHPENKQIELEFRNSLKGSYIIIDRFVNGDFLCDAKELAQPRNDVRKMGYLSCWGIGTYKYPY